MVSSTTTVEVTPSEAPSPSESPSPEQVAVPRVTGVTLAAAQNTLQDAGFKVAVERVDGHREPEGHGGAH